MLTARICEKLSEAVIYLMVAFGPWAFGTTQAWAITTMNIGAYSLGALWLLRLTLAWLKASDRYIGHHPRYSQNPEAISVGVLLICIIALVVLTVAILAYCFLSALNARATFLPTTSTLEYRECCTWLPHSFDSASTWAACWTYLGLASSFWSIRYWLLGKTTAEIVMDYQSNRNGKQPVRAEPEPPQLPVRLRKLIFVMTVNGGLLATECIIQRLLASPRLLFVQLPQIHDTAVTQFGPYAYRANAAQYLNLLWPVCLGVWCRSNRTSRNSGRRKRVVALICVGLMSTASLLSCSKAGVVICAGQLLATTIVFLTTRASASRVRTVHLSPWLVLFLSGSLLAAGFGWSQLSFNSRNIQASIRERERIYAVARQMAKDFGVFGAGPGTYETISEFYRPADHGFWPAQVHNDWLETRITFGLTGSVLILTALVLLLGRWFIPGGLDVGIESIGLIWLALAGCLAHACVDFPFQVHSILFLFVVLASILSTLSRRPWNWQRKIRHAEFRLRPRRPQPIPIS